MLHLYIVYRISLSLSLYLSVSLSIYSLASFYREVKVGGFGKATHSIWFSRNQLFILLNARKKYISAIRVSNNSTTVKEKKNQV